MRGRSAPAGGPVLVTGGAGYIGAHLVLALLYAGREVVVLDNLSTGDRSAVPAGAVFIRGAVQDEALVRRLVRRHDVAAVIHLAAFTRVQDSIERPHAYHLNNTVNARRLIEAAVSVRRMPILLASTAAVYAPRAQAVPRAETGPVGPATPYGLSKLRAEQALAAQAAIHRFPWMALRYFNVAGADPAGRAGPGPVGGDHLFLAAAEAAIGLRRALPIHGGGPAAPDGSCVRDFIHVDDLTRLHLHALARLEGGGANGVVNVGTGRGASVRQVVAAFETRLGRPLPTFPAPARPGDAPHVTADTTRLQRLFPRWRAERSTLADIVDSMLAWTQRAERPQPAASTARTPSIT